MRRRWVVWLLLATPAPLCAQVVTGAVDVGFGQSSFRTGDQETTNQSITQGYSVGYRSVLWDPRFLTYSGELTFHKNALAFDGNDGASRQTGFRTAANLFPSRPFPLSIQASRASGGETGNYASANTARGGLALPVGDAAPLKTRQSEFALNWQLNARALPRVELTYQKTAAAVAAGSRDALQTQSGLHALVSREGPKVRNTVRYARTAFDTGLSKAFAQRHRELSYDLMVTPTNRTAFTGRAGRRSTFSLFDVPTQFTDTGSGAYRPPSTGEVGLHYGVATLTHRSASRLSTDMTISYAGERSDAGGTTATLGTTTTRFELFSGLVVNGGATYGRRGEDLAASATSALTRSVAGGADYAFASRFVQAGAGYDAARGQVSATERSGSTRSWRGRANVSTALFSLVRVHVGYDRGQSEDDVLDLGNLWQERTRATARTNGGQRLMLEANWERATIERGRLVTASRSRYIQRSGTARFAIARDHRLSFTAGDFLNTAFTGNDGTRYLALSLDSAPAAGLRVSITARREQTSSDASGLHQAGYYTTGVLEHRVRLFTFGLEYRYTDLALNTAKSLDALDLSGRQIVFRVGRRFGFIP